MYHLPSESKRSPCVSGGLTIARQRERVRLWWVKTRGQQAVRQSACRFDINQSSHVAFIDRPTSRAQVSSLFLLKNGNDMYPMRLTKMVENQCGRDYSKPDFRATNLFPELDPVRHESLHVSCCRIPLLVRWLRRRMHPVHTAFRFAAASSQ
jgi:hypothetical protein